MEAPGLKKWDPKLLGGGEEREAEGPATSQKRKSTAGRKPGEKRRKANDIVQPEVELPGKAVDPVVSTSTNTDTSP